MPRDVAAGADADFFAKMVAARSERITEDVLARYPRMTMFGERRVLAEDEEPEAGPPRRTRWRLMSPRHSSCQARHPTW